MTIPATGRFSRPGKPAAANPNPSRYRITRSAGMLYVRAEGLANMKSAPVLHAFLNKARDEDTVSVYIDLSACMGMDSTFMGLLVGQAQNFADKGGRLVVVTPNELCLRLLKLLGIDEVVTVISEVDVPTAEYFDLAGDSVVDQQQRTDLVRQAHQHLSALNDENRTKFSAFLKALDEDLAKKKP